MMMARSEGSQFIAIQHNPTNSDPQTTGLRSEDANSNSFRWREIR
jgi:hypothetical protein